MATNMNEHIARLQEASVQIKALARRTPGIGDKKLLNDIARELDKAIEAL